MKKKEQIERIVRMEEKHDRIRDVMDRLLPLLEEYGSLQKEIVNWRNTTRANGAAIMMMMRKESFLPN